VNHVIPLTWFDFAGQFFTIKNKVRMRLWLRVMEARLAPPHGSRSLTEGSPVNMQKHS
jgi:hypothetical protein